MKIKNYTDYQIDYFEKSQCDYDEKGKKWIVGENEKCCATFPVERVLRAQTEDVQVASEKLDATTMYIPLLKRKLVNPDLPETEIGTVSVVSLQYQAAVKEAGYNTDGLVYPEICWGKLANGQLGIVGFVGLIVA